MSAPNARLVGLDDTERIDDSRVGQLVLGRYAIVRCIGAGGMGTVYEVRHQRIGRRMAVKFLRRGLEDDPKTLARFEQEAMAAGALESENIAAILELGTSPDGAPCLVMEYVDGENLALLLEREGPLPIPRAVDLVRQVCRGLRVAHAAHVVHRDLKPRNLIVARRSDGTDLLKIVDFGIAKLGGDRTSLVASTTTGAAMGTPHYMSPEQARGEKQLDARADIYAAGVILYELLTGEKPHTGDSYNAIIYHILSKLPVPLREHRAEVPPGLALVVHRAMASDAKDRFSSAVEFERVLGPYASFAMQRLASDADTVVSAAEPSGRRRRVPRFAITVPFFAGVAATAMLGAIFSRPQPSAATAPSATVEAKRAVSASGPSALPAIEREPPFSALASASSPSASEAVTLATPPASALRKHATRAPSVARSPAAASSGSFDFSNPYE